MFRWIPFALAVFIDSPLNTFVTVLLVAILLLILIPVRPFENYLVNVSDGLLLLNLAILFIGALYYDVKVASAAADERDTIESQATIFSTALVCLAYLQFAAIVLYHLVVIRFPKLHEKLKKLKSMAICKFQSNTLGKQLFGETVIVNESNREKEGEVNKPPEITCTELREPLLEEGDGEAVLVSVSPPRTEQKTQ